MPVFDQRGQQVQYQYNVAGDIHFGAAATGADLVAQLRKLLAEVHKAAEAKVLDADQAIDVRADLERAIAQAERPQPQPGAILQFLDGARAVAEHVAARHGQKIIPPARFYPDPVCLRWHREHRFKVA
jgi:hypothetical protein